MDMADPRLQSVHLQAAPRRDEFRRARVAVENACGQHATLPPLDQSATNRYWLVDRDIVYSLKVGLNTIGRMPDNDVAILDAAISRRHAAIVIHTSDGCELHDTASKNGTFLNGQRIGGPTAIKSGDEIRLCDRCVRFFTGNVTPAPADDRNARTIVE
jgi:pSer/pThr/pTyr-binding forkhead associated (FHA) protein